MLPTSVFQIRYWGVTGSFPNPLTPDEVLEKVIRSIWHLQKSDRLDDIAVGLANLDAIRELVIEHVPFAIRSSYGGNTTCVELRTPQTLIVLDAGSGFRRLGMELTRQWNAEEKADRTAHVLLTHAHLDHTSAIPFVDPYYDPRNHFKIWAPQTALDSLHKLLSPESELRSVYFPPTYECMSGLKSFETVKAGDTFSIGDTTISTLSLNHPGECLAYRFEQDGRVFVFATDHELPDGPDPEFVDFAQGADLLYLDSQYLDDEYAGREGIGAESPLSRQGWGHSTAETAVDTGLAANVKRLHLGHHDPKRDDQHLSFLLHLARRRAEEHQGPNRSNGTMEVELAQEGMELHF